MSVLPLLPALCCPVVKIVLLDTSFALACFSFLPNVIHMFHAGCKDAVAVFLALGSCDRFYGETLDFSCGCYVLCWSSMSPKHFYLPYNSFNC